MCEFDGEIRDLGEVPRHLLDRLDGKIAETGDLWRQADASKPNKFEPFKGSTLHINFQFPVDLRSHQASSYSEYWDDWQDVLSPLIEHATQGYGYQNGRTARIMLARLLAGREVATHVDTSPSAEIPHKIHIPVHTNPDVRFLIDRGDYNLERGRAYEVNNRRPHAVRNNSNEDRVHLIFDYFNNV